MSRVGLLLLLMCASADAQETLTVRLAKESVAAIAKDARQHGDAGRGAVLFFQSFLGCAKCHDAEAGTHYPDIAKAGKEATAEHLIESVLQPSKVIKKGYETVQIVMADGRTISGLLTTETTDSLTLLDPAANKLVTLSKRDVEKRSLSGQSLMPEGLVNLLSDRQQFLDLAKYLIEIAEQGPARAKELRPAVTALVIPEYEARIDHAGLIRAWDAKALERGAAIYNRVCANCHGTTENPGSLPTTPKFATHTFKNGHDPHSLYRTLTHGYSMMMPQTWMVPRQKYDVIHYLREAFLKSGKQYTAVDAAYLAALPKGDTFGPPPATVDAWTAMDYGPAMMNTIEVAKGAIAYKGVAVRLDAGAGGVSRGRRFAMLDIDTLRVVAAWNGDGFIDWKGIHFNGQHGVHPRVAGEVAFSNPIGPGWADTEGSFGEPRAMGRDGKPYGPLPRSWSHFRGTYAYGDRTIFTYRVGDVSVLEMFGSEDDPAQPGQMIVTRTLEVGPSRHVLHARIAPEGKAVAVVGSDRVRRVVRDGTTLLKILPSDATARIKVLVSAGTPEALNTFAKVTPPPMALEPLTHGGPRRWPELLRTTLTTGTDEGPFAVDTFALPERNPWNALIRPTGFDFSADGQRMAVCTWDGDVWLVSGLDRPAAGLTWQRIASGLFQPLGLKIRDGCIFVCCRDQIVKLHDLNGDGETDFYECFNTDHQVTEHFHEFAMGLQTDAEGNFYYAKSGCHGLKATVPQHGTLLKVAKDGSKTEILATGFRAANGVCLNPDGTFFVTDQEGFWNPKNRINLVKRGGFYGNMWGYTDITDTSDAAMEQPLCWITNTFDRSPAEMLWVPKNAWGSLGGSLLNISYGMGKIFVVPHETVNGHAQGGLVALPLPVFPTGVMRGRFGSDGHLYTCGMYAWAGNVTAPGGIYRVRATGKPTGLPLTLTAETDGVSITFIEPLADRVDTNNIRVKVWGLKRTPSYGSKHIDEKTLTITGVSVSNDRKTLRLRIAGLTPTRGMEIDYTLQSADGRPVRGVIHNTIHELPH